VIIGGLFCAGGGGELGGGNTVWNEDPKPFVWTRTAEEILASFARFRHRISGTGRLGGEGSDGRDSGAAVPRSRVRLAEGRPTRGM
jgi:hypothetical protein